eukprot:m.111762 g.111762  ORF g.111762 m.111762 type:complete len:579 (-) comp12769_c0_seq2:26-1762(-)
MMNFRRKNSNKDTSSSSSSPTSTSHNNVCKGKITELKSDKTVVSSSSSGGRKTPTRTRKGSTKPAARSRFGSKSRRSLEKKAHESHEAQTITDILGREFVYNTRTNVAFLGDEFKVAAKTVGPLELSNRHTGTPDKKQLSVKYRELDHYGCVSKHEYLPGLAPGSLDKQLSKHTGLIMRAQVQTHIQQHKDIGGDVKRVAIRVMECLEYCLPVVQNYTYQAYSNSHVWCTDPQNHQFEKEFFSLLPALCAAAIRSLKQDDMVLDLAAPCYVLGDLHGNLRDLQYFAAQFWRAGVDICPSDLLFLGDYVDRGPHSTEVIAYLLALKVLYPKKVFLLRGNHELESVCGNVDYYGEGSFRAQLSAMATRVGMGDALEETWDALMMCFDWMPLAATIDKNIFCCHAGLPRATMSPASKKGEKRESILDRIRKLPRPLIEEEHIDGTDDCIAMDILWADPATSREKHIMGKHGLPPGFALNLERGGDACVFGEDAVAAFSKETNLNFVLRAHQPPNRGIRYQAGAKVITVFSSSHYCGMNNSAALVVVSRDQLDIVTTGKTTSRDKQSRPSSRNDNITNHTTL